MWVQITGIRPDEVVCQPIMFLQAFIDDSYTAGATFVLGGHIATAENWMHFEGEWDNLLQTGGTLAKDGGYHFKMSEMAVLPERMERVPAFWWLIEKYTVASLSFHINIAQLTRARSRIHVPSARIDWGFWANPYLVATRCLLDVFHVNKHKIEKYVPLDQPVDFIFDEQSEKKIIREAWDRYLDGKPPDLRNLYGSTPRFENDRKFLALQAADFWAWWVREWVESGDVYEKMRTLDFGEWRGGKSKRIAFHMSLDEEQLVRELRKGTRAFLGQAPIIYDITFSCKGRPI